MEDSALNPVIGIDFGTTTCSVAVFKNNEVTIIPNEFGSNNTPSYIYIGQDCEKVGLTAKEESFTNPTRTIYGIKRLIGLPFSDASVQDYVPQWPFRVVPINSIPNVQTSEEYLRPEQIAAKLLYYLKKQAEKYLRSQVHQAVITVPVHFNDGQRKAMIDSAAIAGFEDVRILNDPVVAAIAYCHQTFQCPTKKETILIFDIGGGFLNIAVATVGNNIVEVLAVGGDANLGGDNIDNILVELVIRNLHLQKLNSDKNSFFAAEKILAWKKLLTLKNNCEHLKINLSTSKSEVLDYFQTSQIEVSREEFDSLINESLYRRCVGAIDQVISESNLDKSEIDHIILAGASSKIPGLRDYIDLYFGGTSNFSDKLKEDQAVVTGAAIAAATVFGWQDEPNKITVRDVVTRPIGIQLIDPVTNQRYFQKIINKNCPVPCSIYFSSHSLEFGEVPTFVIRQGEDFGDVFKNYLVGEFKGKNLPLNFPLGTIFYLNLHVDSNGIVTVDSSFETKFKSGKINLKECNSKKMSLGDIVRLRIIELSFHKNDNHL